MCELFLWSQERIIARTTWVLPRVGGVCEDQALVSSFYRTFSLCRSGNLQEILVSLSWAVGSVVLTPSTQLCQLLGHSGFLPAVCCGAASSRRPWQIPEGDRVGTIQSENPASAPDLEALTPSTQLRVLLLNPPLSPNPQPLNSMPGTE